MHSKICRYDVRYARRVDDELINTVMITEPTARTKLSQVNVLIIIIPSRRTRIRQKNERQSSTTLFRRILSTGPIYYNRVQMCVCVHMRVRVIRE